jgi:hypothetical protein
MRTKTLLLTAALAAAGVASSMAQVYSVNLVGYINKQVPKGFAMIANQLNNGTGNKVVDLIPNPPDNTFVYKFDKTSGGYTIIDFLGGWEGDDLNMTLSPGEGVFISSPSAHTATFVGEVQLASSVPIAQGFSIISSVVPQSSPLDTIGFPAVDGDFVYQYDSATGGYRINDFLGGWEGDDNGVAPTPAIGESFFLYHPTTSPASTWNRTFTVN